MNLSPLSSGARRQRGFTLVEMMVAVGIGLVVALGFAVSFVNLKATWGTQDKLSQLQDNERLAMSFLTTSVEQAGYYPDATKATSIGSSSGLNGSMSFGGMNVGQALTGSIASGSTPVSLSTQYSSASGDGVLNCLGGTNASGSTVTFRNTFYVNTTTKTLNCVLFNSSTPTVAGTDTALISNVSSMGLLFAVDVNGDGSAYQYMTADTVTTKVLWGAVKSVRVTLNFVNPNTAGSTIAWTQTINAMNNR